jgi:CarD family transcriptional regulator
MAQSKKVATPVVAAKSAKAKPDASKTGVLKHKSAGASKPVAKSSAAKSKTSSAPAQKTSQNTAQKTATKPVANAATAKPVKKVAVKTVAKTVSKPTATATKASAAKKPVKAPVAAKASPTKAAPIKAPVAAAKPVFNKDSVRAAVNPAASQAKAMPAAVAKPAAQRITAPVAPKVVPVKAVAAVVPAPVAASVAAAAKKPVSARHGFKTNEYVVYPAHGVGRIVGIEEQEIAGMSLELFVITFDKDKMTLRVPTGKLTSVGMRKLAEEPVVRRSMETLKGRARVKRTMWSRRAQEYEAKINSGDLVAIAEVVRDLYRSETQPEQSYSERQLYEAALDRMSREIAAVEKLDERGAVQRITEILAKSAKGRRLAAEGAEAEAALSEADDEGDDVKAA